MIRWFNSVSINYDRGDVLLRSMPSHRLSWVLGFNSASFLLLRSIRISYRSISANIDTLIRSVLVASRVLKYRSFRPTCDRSFPITDYFFSKITPRVVPTLSSKFPSRLRPHSVYFFASIDTLIKFRYDCYGGTFWSLRGFNSVSIITLRSIRWLNPFSIITAARFNRYVHYIPFRHASIAMRPVLY